jgi:hypothetical protein
VETEVYGETGAQASHTADFVGIAPGVLDGSFIVTRIRRAFGFGPI